MILTRPHPYAYLLRNRNKWQKADLFLKAADELDDGVREVMRLRAEVEALRKALEFLVQSNSPEAVERALATLAAGRKLLFRLHVQRPASD